MQHIPHLSERMRVNYYTFNPHTRGELRENFSNINERDSVNYYTYNPFKRHGEKHRALAEASMRGRFEGDPGESWVNFLGYIKSLRNFSPNCPENRCGYNQQCGGCAN